jgi:Rrf2 family transcriptional regulator, nitric oxide-sensitive transcriptional repressor
MKLTRFTDYGLRVLIFVGVRGGDRTTIREISEAYDISRHHLMKVVSDLVRLGYLDAQRGPGGGIKLARPAGEIGLAHVVLDMEEDMNIVSCFEGEGRCVIQAACRLREALKAALAAYLGTLEAYTLQDLITPNKALARMLHLS